MGFAMSDIFSGTCAFAGPLVTLRDRDRTGCGTRVDVGMFDAALLMNDLPMTYQNMVGETMGRGQCALQSPWGHSLPTTGMSWSLPPPAGRLMAADDPPE
jgi:formyl-CoA transferase